MATKAASTEISWDEAFGSSRGSYKMELDDFIMEHAKGGDDRKIIPCPEGRKFASHLAGFNNAASKVKGVRVRSNSKMQIVGLEIVPTIVGED